MLLSCYDEMNKEQKTAMLAAAVMVISVVFVGIGGAVPGSETRVSDMKTSNQGDAEKENSVRVKIYATGEKKERLQEKHGVRHDFGDVFTTTVNEQAFQRLKDRDVRVARVEVYQIIHHQCGHSGGPPGDSEPDDCSGISVSWVNPSDGETVSGNVTIQIDASDSDGTIKDVRWQVDGGSWRTTTINSDSGYYEATWDTATAGDGDHTLTAQAEDNDTNLENVSISVSVDNSGDDSGGNTRVSDQTPYGIEQIYDNSSISETSGGGDVDIAMLDTGVDTDHPDLVNRLEECVDFTAGGPFQTNIDEGSCEDKNGHGTHTAGTALADAGSDNAGIYGVAPAADLYAYKVCGGNGCYADDIAAAINYAGNHGAEIVSMSLGGDSQSDLISGAIDDNNGQILFVAAAGNDGPKLETMDYPGADPDVVGVAAVNESYGVPDFSSRGNDSDSFAEKHKRVEVAAAGVDVLSAWNDGGYNTASGTSMATPHVSGFAAKVWASGDADISDDGTTTPDEVRTYIQNRAEDTDITDGIHAESGYDAAAGIGLPTVV